MKALKWSIMVIMLFVFLSTNALAGIWKAQIETNTSTVWKFKTKGDIHASALVDNGVVYIGSLDSSFYAINASTGSELWRFKTKDQIYTTAVKNENIVCFESGNVLYGLNLQGILQWKFTLYDGAFVNQNDEWDYYRSSPYLTGNTVYIGSEKGLVYGIDITNGTKTFQCQAPTAKYSIETKPLIYDNKIYVGDWDGVFYVFNLSDGTLAWQFDTKTDGTYSWVTAIVTDPVVYKDAVYFGGRSCNLYCFDSKTGTQKWKYHDSGSMWIVGGPTIVDDVVYVGSSYQHVVRMINALTGTLVKEVGATYRVNGMPFVEGDYVYVGTEHDTDLNLGTLLAIEKSTGRVKAKMNMGAQVYSSPILSNGLIYFGATDDYVYAVNKESFLNTPYPDTYMTCPNTIDLGTLKNTGDFSTTVNVYNKGMAVDSVDISSFLSRVKFEPAAFILPPNDSQAVTIKVNLEGMSANKYSGRMNVTSYKGVSKRLIMKTISFTVENTSAAEQNNDLPKELLLGQNYPNPFNPTTKINYSIPATTSVRLTLYDVLGKEVMILVNEEKSPGNYTVDLNAQKLAAGIYFYNIQTGETAQTKKLVLMK